jgi:LacI family transcriptional regulator
MTTDGTSIYTIADLAGVSVATVSRVVNGKPGVGEETRKRVLKLLREHNFQPRMSRNTTNTLGVFGSFMGENPFSNPYTHRILEGVSNIAFPYGFDMMIVPLERTPKSADEFRVFCQTRGIAAGVFFLLHELENYVLDFEEILPISVIGTAFQGSHHISAKADNAAGARLAIRHLTDLGHRRIMFVEPEAGFQDHTERLNGYRQGLEEAGIEFDPALILDYEARYDKDFSSGLERSIASKDNPVTAIFAINDRCANRIYSEIQRLGLAIPDDISVVGFDDDEFSAHLSPPLTTVRQPVEELAERATRAVIDLAAARGGRIDDIVLPTKFIVRKSTAQTCRIPRSG